MAKGQVLYTECTMRISAIAIITKDRGLGKDNKLLFHIPGELPRLKAITMGHPIIMGRKTFESIGRVLPGRTNIIITRDSSYKIEGALVVHNLQDAIEEGRKKEEERLKNYSSSQRSESRSKKQFSTSSNNTDSEPEIFILGGGQIFQEAMPLTDRLYLTIVDTTVPADVYFPDYSEFKKVIAEEKKTDWEHPYTFLTLER